MPGATRRIALEGNWSNSAELPTAVPAICLLPKRMRATGRSWQYQPNVAVITNIEFDHMEHFKDEQTFVRCFDVFAAAATERVVYWGDDRMARGVVAKRPAALCFGRDVDADVRLLDAQVGPATSDIVVQFPGGWLAVFPCSGAGHV